MTVSCPGLTVYLVGRQGMDNSVKHFLVQRSRDLGVLDQFFLVLGEIASLPEQALQS
jgi:hypothetical protein